MKKKSSPVANENDFNVFGTVLNKDRQPVGNLLVHVYDHGIRSHELLGTATTDKNGKYSINYAPPAKTNFQIIVSVYDNHENLLAGSEVQSNVSQKIEVNVEVDKAVNNDIRNFDQLVQAVTAVADGIALSQLTETAAHSDITFITTKTDAARTDVERLLMASRFYKLSTVPDYIWYGILSAGLPRQGEKDLLFAPSADFETRLMQTFDALMHTATAELVSAVQRAIDEQVIDQKTAGAISKISQQLDEQLQAYAKQHPVSGQPSALHRKAALAGLSGKELQSFVEAHSQPASDSSLAKTQTASVVKGKNMDKVQAVFELARLTGEDIALTEKLIDTKKIKTPADLKKLAAYDKSDWEAMLKEQTPATAKSSLAKGSQPTADTNKKRAALLEKTFTKAFPTSAFAARLEKDKTNKLPNKEKITQFLQNNEQFDLLRDRVGTYINNNKGVVASKDTTEVADLIRRVQRVFKLAPDYTAANMLLEDNIHSAQQIYNMGKENFVNTYGDRLGEKEAAEIFDKASEVHGNAISLIGNLKSMADASAIKAFPNFTQQLNQLAPELPTLETLFGHTDFCECADCNSVYGAPAYLTDILHFLDKRLSTLPLTGSDAGQKRPTVKDLLLRRRPDIADIDLECNNANTEIPYIDIACELMEDYIAPPVVTIANTFLPKLVKGKIDIGLLTEIVNQFNATGQSNIASLLTANAMLSVPYSINRLQANNTYLTPQHVTIRDSKVVLRTTSVAGGANIEVRLLHQTLLPSEAVGAGPEYINRKVYDISLKDAKRPFSLPFDLFETEGRLYLEKLGTSKADLIHAFRKQYALPEGSTPADQASAYASLGINEAELTLIFDPQPNAPAQQLFWGPAGATTAVTVNEFEKLADLNYSQVMELVPLRFTNPGGGIVIEHDDLSADTTRQRIRNLSPDSFDAYHRFLRLWRKTPFTMTELDALIDSSSIGHTNIDNKLAWQIQQVLLLQQTLGLTVFELLALYQNLDVHYHFPDCQYNLLFQNNQVTNPLHPDFAIGKVTEGTLTITDERKMVICAVLQVSMSDLELLVATTSGRLSLHNLSIIYRHVKFARSLQISIPVLLTLLQVIDADPFADPLSTQQFIRKYKTLQASGFDGDELNYILFHRDNAAHSLVPSATQVAAALSQLQDELLAARVLTEPVADPNGSLLTKWLSDPALKWDSSVLNKLLDILATAGDEDYQKKIDDNNNFLLNLRQLYHDVSITAALSALPLVNGVPVTFPASIASQLSFDADRKQLKLVGYMSQSDLDTLKALSSDAFYQNALTQLFTQAQQTNAGADNIFFENAAAIQALRNIPFAQIAGRFALFLAKLSPAYRQLKQQEVLVKDISTWFTVDRSVVEMLLASVPGIYNDFTNDQFVNRVAASYQPQIDRYQFVAKTCFVAARLKVSPEILAFAISKGTHVGCLDFIHLPVSALTPPVVTFTAFDTFVSLLRLEQLYPVKLLKDSTGNTFRLSIYTILTDFVFDGIISTRPKDLGALTDDLVNSLQQLTGWSVNDLNTLLRYIMDTASDVNAIIDILVRLHRCFGILNQMDIAASDAINWCKASLTFEDATAIKQALKGKYSDSDWPQITRPLQDVLREKKRDVLIAYLLANPGTQTWKDDNDLYSYFLLDVEMCSCQPTSRIVQATNSVQLFVQRSFLGLEANILVDSKLDSNWQQWKWMKNFRVWQANVKVFLYPENWIEPELLPEEIKSPFLKELEDELLQNEVTALNAENAFQSYLQKLESIARLEVKGMWYDSPTKTLHVFARTFGGNPRVYYHRKLVNDRRWTPWKKIDLDITSDHIVPAVYNNRLYLFWAIFTEQTEKTVDPVSIPKPDASGNYSIPVATPKKNWQIQLAFSEYKNGKWTPKKISENDDTGRLTVKQSLFSDKQSFVFTALDVPDFDYSKIFIPNDPNHGRIDTPEVFNQKAAVSIHKNGKLVISCYYYSFVGNDSFENLKYVGSFRLDPVKGYPTQLSVNYKIKLAQANTRIERSGRKSVMVNMLDAESFTGAGAATPPTTGIPGSGPGGQILVAEQAGGAFGNVIPIQMDVADRTNYMLNIYNNGFGVSFTIQNPLSSRLPYFYQDLKRSYYVVNEYSDNGAYEFLYSDFLDATFVFLEQGADAYAAIFNQIPANVPQVFISRYFNFHHPLVDYFMQQLFAGGIDGLMDRTTQLKGDFGFDPDPAKFNFQDYFRPVISGFNSIYNGSALPPVVHNGVTDQFPGYPKDDVDFNLQSGYGLYNWELFFHAPLMIAERLSQNQQFEEADRWYKYIFNPMDTSAHSSPSKYWNTKPFFLTANQDYINERIENILKGINSGQLDLVKDVADWRANPFQPHFIAQFRTVAYQKTAVMKYIGHLIRHGDQLFRQHTAESVNEATQLYILAAEILGPKPEVIPPVASGAVDSYYQLEKKLDAFSDALVDVENLLPFHTVKGYNGTTPTQGLPNLKTMYFCIPMNENLAGPTGYWDVVADRLFKIRHCLDIDGTFAPLSLFAPAIDPGLLVRAAAAGLNIGSILNDITAPLPLYRFMIMIQKANELVNEVKVLGNAMLSALEKKDGEAMSLLRSGHEIKMTQLILAVKEQQKKDAQSALDGLNKQKELINVRKEYYNKLINDGLSIGEKTALGLNGIAALAETGIALGYGLAGGLSLIPNFVIGVSGLGSPVGTATEGGEQFAAAADHAVKALSALASAADKNAALIGTISGYQRRADEWRFQKALAEKELEQVAIQITGAEVRVEIAKKDYDNQQAMIDQAQEANDFMRSKFTNEELFSWMITQLSNTYFKSYQLAYDIAKQAERCFRYELGLADSAYINFGYWDNLKKGLLAGEQLAYDVRKMEMAYFEENKRELELTKPISISQLDPVALLKLKTTGECWINLPEELFDMDYPGHYMRRVKSVSLTIPCISGPYTTVSCKLTMTRSSVRSSGIASGSAAQYPRKQVNGIPADDPRFRDASGTVQSIATSSAQNDSGLFELNFRDERYLPFEGSGAISLWHLQLPAAVRQFDYNTISDVIIHLRYTARDGGEALRAHATESLQTRINQMLVSLKDKGLMRIFSAKNDLPSEWYRFLHPDGNVIVVPGEGPGVDQVLTLNLDKTRFPLFAQDKTIKITGIELAADSRLTTIDNLNVVSPVNAGDALSLGATGIYGNALSGSLDYGNNKKDPGVWVIKNPAANTRLTEQNISNMVIIVRYEIA